MEELKVGIVIQARTGSKRFPSKVLKKIGQTSMIKFLIKRMKLVKNIDQIIVATSKEVSDDILVKHLLNIKNITIYRGSLENVLKRFYKCSRENQLDVIVRVTADDPFKDPIVISNALNIFKKNKYDYVSNTIIPTYPEGIDVEIFSYDALEYAFKNSKIPSEMLHVTPYIWKNKNLFNLHNFIDKEDNSHIRLTCDYEEDFIFLNKIYSYINSYNFSYTEVLKVIKTFKIEHTRQVKRNEGYTKDLNNDD